MRNFTIMALEERIVLDATLINAADFITKTVSVGQAVDLSGGGYPLIGLADGWSVGLNTELSSEELISSVLNTGGGTPSQVNLVNILSGPGSNFISGTDGTFLFDASAEAVTYNTPGVYHPLIHFIGSGLSDLVIGEITVLPLEPQRLWGVDENSNQLFSVADYSVAGAEGRVTLYGQLHTALGNVDGKVQAFTIDGADASGKNAAYIAISGLEDGLNNFSIGVIADINDAANRTEVTLYKISGLKFDAQRDRITGLAVDPISGNLMGVVTRSGSPDTLFVIDKNTLSSADHIAKGYTIGKIIGKDDLGGLKVTNARDLAFDENGNLFVTDGAKDKLYRISVGTGEILAVANMNEDNGVGEANIEALAWDPILNKMVGANALLNGGNDLVGLSLENGPNSIDVHLLQSLGDIQGMAFAPEFALRAGDDLGVLIDIARSQVEYEVGDGPMLLLRNVELVSFGEDTYDGGSLTVDVSGIDVNEFFAIKAGDGIKVNAAGEVRYKGLWIGTIDALNNGKNGNALTVNFTANAGEKAVESLMQRITYLNTNSTLALGERIISFTIKDSLGAIIGYTTIDLQIEAEDSSHC